MKEDMHAYGIPLIKMTPVPMGVSDRIFEWAESNRVSVVPNRIVYLGTLAAVRKLDMLLDAFLLVKQTVPGAQLIFVGDGDIPSERQALVQRATALGLADAVTFTGFVPMEDAWTLSASAAVCLSPFYPTSVLTSTSPTKIVEYMALGRPIVCNDHPEQSKIIQDSGAGICVPWSAQAFSKAIEALLQSTEKAESMAERGPAWVRKNRTYPIIAKAVWEKYQCLVGTEFQ